MNFTKKFRTVWPSPDRRPARLRFRLHGSVYWEPLNPCFDDKNGARQVSKTGAGAGAQLRVPGQTSLQAAGSSSVVLRIVCRLS